MRPVKEWPANDLEHVTTCPVCGSVGRRQIHDGLTDNVFFVAPGRWTLWQCVECEAGYLDPRPSEASIGRAYDRYYTHDHVAPPPPRTAYQRLRAALGNGYRNARYGTRLSPSSPLGNWVGRLVPWFRAPVDAAYRWLPHSEGKKVLDVGCGGGDWLEIAREAGWDVFGVEPDPVARGLAEAKGIKLWPAINDIPRDTPRFDFITLSHVIEHVHDPVGLLRSCHALLKPGATIYIDTPNMDAIGHKRFGRNWRGLETPRHLVIFGRKSLLLALEKAGFCELSSKTKRMFGFMSRQSLAMSRGLNPFADASASVALSVRVRPAITRRRTEFLTLIAAKSEA